MLVVVVVAVAAVAAVVVVVAVVVVQHQVPRLPRKHQGQHLPRKCHCCVLCDFVTRCRDVVRG